MTNEEAIELIGSMKGDLCDFYDDNDLTALEMAISALKDRSTDIMECVKAIQEYCKYNECETCIFATRKSLDHVQTDKGGYYCHCGFTDGVAQNWRWGEADEN